MRYKIVQANEPERLSEQVEELLNTGWQLHGGLLMTPTSSLYTQALVSEQGTLTKTVSLTSEDLGVIRRALKHDPPLNSQQGADRQRANQILSDLEGDSSGSEDTERDKD